MTPFSNFLHFTAIIFCFGRTVILGRFYILRYERFCTSSKMFTNWKYGDKRGTTFDWVCIGMLRTHLCSDALSVIRCPHCQRQGTRYVRIVDIISKLKNSEIGWQICEEICNKTVITSSGFRKVRPKKDCKNAPSPVRIWYIRWRRKDWM